MEYDNSEFMGACVDLYCEITGIDKKTVPKVQVPFIENNMVDLGIGAESEVDPLSNMLAYQSLKELLKYDHPSQFTQQLNHERTACGQGPFRGTRTASGFESGNAISVGASAPLTKMHVSDARDAQPYYDEESKVRGFDYWYETPESWVFVHQTPRTAF